MTAQTIRTEKPYTIRSDERGAQIRYIYSTCIHTFTIKLDNYGFTIALKSTDRTGNACDSAIGLSLESKTALHVDIM